MDEAVNRRKISRHKMNLIQMERRVVEPTRLLAENIQVAPRMSGRAANQSAARLSLPR